MLSAKELGTISRARLKDAKVLLRGKRFDGAAYLCGYAIEIAIKKRIVKTLKWSGFPETGEFRGLDNFRTHDLQILLKLSGWEARIITNFRYEWSTMKIWNPESRYARPGNVTDIAVREMIASAEILLGVL
jgi:hypothetical protein